MYKIYADTTPIYDSTMDEYRIGKGSISLETNKSGSFSFSVYPDHFYYDKFVRLKTVIKVEKSNKIIFRGRILNDSSDYRNNKTVTCEGELGFFQDSIIRPFEFVGTLEEFLRKLVEEHNAQVDEFKRFKVGVVTVGDSETIIARNSDQYATTFESLNTHLLNDTLGGYLHITHGEDGTEDIPTLNLLSAFTKVASQKIEFGSNLKNYTKTVKAEEIATAIIPTGYNGLTIKHVNDGIDYVYSPEGVELYGWIFKVVSWSDIANALTLKAEAEKLLNEIIKQNITIELNAIDLHLLDQSIESFNVGDYIQVISEPHNFNETLLCNKQTIDLLKPENDSLTLGYTYSSFTEKTSKNANVINSISAMQTTVTTFSNKVVILDKTVADNTQNVTEELTTVTLSIEELAQLVATNSSDIEILKAQVKALEGGQ